MSIISVRKALEWVDLPGLRLDTGPRRSWQPDCHMCHQLWYFDSPESHCSNDDITMGVMMMSQLYCSELHFPVFYLAKRVQWWHLEYIDQYPTLTNNGIVQMHVIF